MSGRLEGKVALITGTGSGQGRAAALLFAKEGAKVAGCDLHASNAEETARLVRETGGTILSTAPVDLGDPNNAKAWVDEVAEHFGGIDILYNNAGAATYGPFGVMPLDDWRFTMRNEVDIVYYATRAAWPHLVARGGGSIINTASIISDRVTVIPLSVHGVAKGAVASFAPHLAVEGGPHGIRVNTISPGLIDTPATEMFLRDPNSAIHRQVRTSPLGRAGLAEDIAPVALFLASDDSRYVTGANIVVDGGQTLGIALNFGEDSSPTARDVNAELRDKVQPTAAIAIETLDGLADAYLFTPSRAMDASWPAVLMYTDIMGVRPVMMMMAQRVADLGFTVMLPNLFYRLGPPFDPPKSVHNPEQLGFLLEASAGLTRDVMERDAPAFLAALRAHPAVTAAGVGCLGYCMSGPMAVWTAHASPEIVTAVATFHGAAMATPTDDSPAKLAAATNVSYYFGLAENDPFMTPDMIALLDEQMADSRAQYTAEIYPGTFHGFAVLDGSFSPEAADRHYEALREHFGATLSRA